jgi:hypothetical protein
MPRKEQFAFGAALVTAALAIILSKSLAWLVLILGLGLVFDFYLRDLIWGPDRLSREEIEKMSGEEYKARVLGNPKTENWVNWLVSGNKVFKAQMRKLAREAVIFVLVTPVLAFAGNFGYLYHDAHKPIPIVPGSWELIKCTDGDKYVEGGKLVWSCQNGVRTEPIPPGAVIGPPIPPPPAGYTPISPDPYAEYGGHIIDLSAGIVPKPTSELLVSALWFGLYGIPAGLGLWLLYRAVLFAVKG